MVFVWSARSACYLRTKMCISFRVRSVAPLELYDCGQWSPWVDVRLIQELEPPCILTGEPECRRAGFRFQLNHTGCAARGSAHLLGCKCELSFHITRGAWPECSPASDDCPKTIAIVCVFPRLIMRSHGRRMTLLNRSPQPRQSRSSWRGIA